MSIILNSVSVAVAHVKAAVIENSERNGASFVSWVNGAHAVETYVDGDTAALAAGVSKASVTVAVDNWLKAEVAFAVAMRSSSQFISWCAGNDVTSEVVGKMVIAGQRNEAPDWSDDFATDYVTTLASGEVVAWGAEHSDGRELIVLSEDKCTVGSIKIPTWRESDAA